MSAPLLRLVNLHKSYAGLQVLQGISLTVQQGEVIALLGPSGCGKSTLLRCLNYLEVPDQGEVWLREERIGLAKTETELNRQRARIGMVFQHMHLFPHLTVLQNVMVGPTLVKKLEHAQAEQLARDLLDRIGLLDKQHEMPARLSGGQQQRVAIARALAMHPEVLLFDEPTSSLDPELVGEVLDVMRELANQGMTMLVVTHEISFAQQVAQRVLFLDQGKVLVDGPAQATLAQPPVPRMREFLARVRHLPSEPGRG